MPSKIAKAIKLSTSPVAVLWSDDKPDNALQFQEGKWGCVVSMINAVSKGKTAVFDRKTFGCGGGAVGLGFQEFKLGYIEYFLSTGTPEQEGEFYRKDPDCARGFAQSLPQIKVPAEYVVLKPVDQLAAGEAPKAVIFLVNADQLSALVTLASFDRPTSDNVAMIACAGCHSAILYPVVEQNSENSRAFIGCTDISARKFLDAGLLSFSLPFKRFLELENEVENSFLTKKEWLKVAERI